MRAWTAGLAFATMVILAMPVTAQTLYYMRDAPEGPVVDGVLSWMPPPPVPDPAAPQYAEAPGTRLVPPMLPVQFATRDAENNTGRIRGPVIVGLWAPDLQTTQNATLRAELVQLSPSDLPVRPEGIVLATADVAVAAGNLTPPDPTPWVPADPTDAEAAAAHIAAHAAAYALPMLLQAPYVVFFTGEGGMPLDVEVPADADIGVRFSLVPADGQLVPLAAAQPLEYDFALAPSFIYVSWYTEPEPKPSTTKTTTPRTSTPPPRTTLGGNTGGPDGDADAPGLTAAFVLVGLAGIVALRRRL